MRDAYLSVDVRWLGIFRILYGGLLIAELARRWPGLSFYYSDDGILPGTFARLYAPSCYSFSLYFAVGSVWAVELAFAATLLCFVFFTLGYRTRLFHALSLLCITSLDSRNVLLENAGTTVVNLLGAWTLFLPLGRCFSIDSLLGSLRARNEASSKELNERSNPRVPNEPYRSLAVLGLILQWSAIYFLNFVHKAGPSWRSGSALHWFLQQNRIVTPFGVWVRSHLSTDILAALSRSALFGEACLTVALLVPAWRRQVRLVALVAAFALHGAIAACARLGPFSAAMVLGYVIFLSAADTTVVSRWFGRASRARTVVYDSDCGICLLICRVLKRLDPTQRLTFRGNDERALFPRAIDSALLERSLVVILPSGALVSEGRAVFEVLRALPFGVLLGWWLRVPGLAPVGDALYRSIARNRTEISAGLGLAACGVPVRLQAPGAAPLRGTHHAKRGVTALRVLRELLAAGFMVTLATQALLDNQCARQRVHVRRARFMAAIVESGRMFEGWSMLAPEPPHEDGHLVVDGRTVDGRRLDPFTRQAPQLDPITETGWGGDRLWCDYTNNLRLPTGARFRPLLGAYLRRWQGSGHADDRLVQADVWWVRSMVPAPGERRGTALPPQRLITVDRATQEAAP